MVKVAVEPDHPDYEVDGRAAEVEQRQWWFRCSGAGSSSVSGSDSVTRDGKNRGRSEGRP